MAFGVSLTFVVVTTLAICHVCVCQSLKINTTHGYVQGRSEEIQLPNGQKRTVDMFLGIPYAKPPTGDLRFRRPEQRGPWVDVWQATELPKSCMQVLNNDPIIVPNPPAPLSEDCLYLNIWKPVCTGQDKPKNDSQSSIDKLPTIVWLHGGLITTGSSSISLYDGAKLAASECIIVVSLNYRLGALGFMSLDIPENPGNMGLLDATIALKWINDNVENFGGEKNNFTLYGNGAGGTLVAGLLLSPLSRDLIKNAILESGTIYSPLVYQSKETAVELALEFSNMFNCSSSNKSHIVECLKQVDPTALANAHFNLSQGLTKFMSGTLDGYSVTQPPRDQLINGDFKSVDIIAGSTQDDGVHILATLWPEEFNLRKQQPPQPLTDEELDKKLAALLSTAYKTEHITKIIADLKGVYKFNELKQQNTNASILLLIKVATDIYFTCPSQAQVARYLSQRNNDYLYMFKHRPDHTRLAEWVGVTHRSDVPFVFGNTIPDIPTFSPKEVELSQTMMTFWSNFAKHGNPTPLQSANPKWPSYSQTNFGKMMVFTESAGVEVGQAEDKICVYWNTLPKEYYKI